MTFYYDKYFFLYECIINSHASKHKAIIKLLQAHVK